MPAILTNQEINQLTKRRALLWVPFGVATLILGITGREKFDYMPLEKVEFFPPALAKKADENGVVNVPAIARWLDKNHDKRISREELFEARDLSSQLKSNWYTNVAQTRKNLIKVIDSSETVLEIEEMLNLEDSEIKE